MSYESVSYSDLYTLLNELALEEHPSELHGLMTGWLISEEHSRVSLDAIAPQASTNETLKNLVVETKNLLEDEQMRFMPLLPEEGRSSQERSEGLAHWCIGLTTSLGMSGFDSAQYPELMEVVEDLVAISQIDFENVVDEDETELEELVEYVRMAVILIDTEVRSVDDNEGAASSSSDNDDQPPTIH